MPLLVAATDDTGRKADETFKADLLSLVPFLRAFTRVLCGGRDYADDLAQDTLVRAWQARSSFAPGTNLKAWLFTIARNGFYSHGRRAWRQMPWDQESAERIDACDGDADSSLELSDLRRALSCLSDEQREALLLIGAGGFSYEEAAEISGCAVGTVKSRVARARRAVMALLDDDGLLPARPTDSMQNPAGEIMAELHQILQRRSASQATMHAAM
jgi:RNA polymerase sigma-70 factor, ECF subfamily